MLGKFVQVMLGPQWDVVRDDLDAMVDYGVLCAGDKEQLRSFSEGFGEYVRFVEGSVELWPLWRDTERVLRDGIEARLRACFGVGWPEEIKKARPKLAKIVDKCQEMMSQEQGRFGSRAAPTLLAYTYPADLYQIMAADWSTLGEPLLGPDKQGWAVKFGVLAKVRTPLAHNREEAVSDGERLQSEGICRQILDRLGGGD
jgi:hypothetical protein